MAAHLTEKENFLRTVNGEIPEYVPTFRMMEWMFTCSAFRPSQEDYFEDGGKRAHKNLFGVTYVGEPTIGGAALPKPGDFILDDIRKWRDVVKRPAVMDEMDWEKMAKKDLDNRDPETLRLVEGGISMGYFQTLVAFMGFTEGLIACIEEPDEVKELMNFLLELNLETGKKHLEYYKPDMYYGLDDIAHERAPFVSEEIFLDIFEPVWRAEIKQFKDEGLLAQHHNCGYFEPFVPHIVNMGFNSWDGVQDVNDIAGIKERYLGKLTICAGLGRSSVLLDQDATEEQVRSLVRSVMDKYAPGGSYCFSGGGAGPSADEKTARRGEWIRDEYEKNKFKYYT